MQPLLNIKVDILLNFIFLLKNLNFQLRFINSHRNHTILLFLNIYWFAKIGLSFRKFKMSLESSLLS